MCRLLFGDFPMVFPPKWWQELDPRTARRRWWRGYAGLLGAVGAPRDEMGSCSLERQHAAKNG